MHRGMALLCSKVGVWVSVFFECMGLNAFAVFQRIGLGLCFVSKLCVLVFLYSNALVFSLAFPKAWIEAPAWFLCRVCFQRRQGVML